MSETSSGPRGPMQARPADGLSGRLAAPGDKSVSHRAFIFGALARGETRISGLLESEDVLNTGKAMAALGAKVERTGPGAWQVTGCAGQFSTPAVALDFGNAGTGVRLVMGVVAGAGVGADFIGDASLSSRPMRRVTDPLGAMGAQFETTDGRLPAHLEPSRLHGIDYTPPVASAQVKSAILLAGLGAQGETRVHEPQITRDHTETMLKAFGAEIDVARDGPASTIRLTGPQILTACPVDVPGDPSSSAFALVAALIIPDSEVTLTGVMDNPARTGLFTTLQEMGADLTLTPGPDMAGEKTMTITARTSALKGIEVPAERAPAMIDEYPILSVAAAFAEGTTFMPGLEELRAKESDRLAGTAALLAASGVRVEAGEDSLTVHGAGLKGVEGGGQTATHHDHRLAMSGLVLGLASRAGASVDDVAMIATSYPDFFDHMRTLGAVLEPV
ncbi:MAG: 3-phosphoshikimate 1-carboxyvinyltransferase [Alphaproteobacteria bacterium]|uniref:3-phosphoshikimate 1-carboxyvinyltransferase n=1 Tax=Maricaulis alexandrii TaxID=2570354 RepID=UPI00110A0070|nr:3-phosphoshikimate 1-carboxyvinyltransferase [Maricaulis alexandrii]MCR9266056.1 3-phosphoshikimate 1-carboxyvinyltransferase [Alphaproteobacteria bacterium]